MANLCMVVGTSPTKATAVSSVFNGSTWSNPLNIANMTSISSLSCVETSFCMASGAAQNTTGTIFAIFSGTSWSPSYRMPVPDVGLSCTSAKFCAAISGDQAAVFNGSQWSSPSSFPGARLTSLSCASPSRCIGVGPSADGPGTEVAFDGSTWSVEPARHPLDSVACGASGNCLAMNTENGDAYELAANRFVALDPGPLAEALSCPGDQATLGCVVIAPTPAGGLESISFG